MSLGDFSLRHLWPNQGFSLSRLIMLSLAVVSVVLAVVLTRSTSTTSSRSPSSFYVVPLGTSGGLDESNLSSYLLTSVDDTEPNSVFVALDGGTIRHGIESVGSINFSFNWMKCVVLSELLCNAKFWDRRVIARHSFARKSRPIWSRMVIWIISVASSWILQMIKQENSLSLSMKQWWLFVSIISTIKPGQISAPPVSKYVDITSPTRTTLSRIVQTYDYQILDPLTNQSVPIQNTDLDVRIFRLCHTCPFLSSAFLVSRRQTSASILYLGDTGPDDVEKIPLANNHTYSPRYLDRMWQDVAPLVANGQLKAIFIEVSYANGRPDHLLFGHLTPDWLLKELRVLSSYSPMKQVKIIVTHIKPDKEAKSKIQQQLTKDTEREFSFIFPEQGEPIWLWTVFSVLNSNKVDWAQRYCSVRSCVRRSIAYWFVNTYSLAWAKCQVDLGESFVSVGVLHQEYQCHLCLSEYGRVPCVSSTLSALAVERCIGFRYQREKVESWTCPKDAGSVEERKHMHHRMISSRTTVGWSSSCSKFLWSRRTLTNRLNR